MNDDKPAKNRHEFNVTISDKLFKKMKFEHKILKTVKPGSVGVGVIGRIIEVIEKGYKSVELNYKGE